MKKNKLFVLLSTLFIMAVLMYSCVDDDFDTPESNPIPVGNLMTISELKGLYSGGDYIFSDTVSVVATVTMDDKSGNIYKTAYIQDATGGIALHLDASGGLYQGDSIRVQLYGLKIGKYAELFQIDAADGNGFNLDNCITKIKTLVDVQPKLVTINEITKTNSLGLQGMLVKLEGVQFVAGDTAATYADAENQVSLDLVIENSDGDNVVVRTSGYSSFADQKVPDGNGSLIAIVGQYNSTMQLYIRSTDEVIMNGDRVGTSANATGTGTFEDPFNVSAGFNYQGQNGVWVQGYIVGVYETDGATNVASFSSPFNTNTNMLIADNANETNINNCLIVQLPYGDIRTALNLKDNSGNLSKQVKLLGDLTNYFNVAGLKNLTGYWMDGTGIIPETGFYEEDFASDISNYQAFSVAGDQVWGHDTYDNGCAKMTGHTSVDNANEDWLVSPAIDLSSKTNVKLVIREAINFFTSYDDLKVLVSTDYDGASNPSTQGTWTALTGFNRPAGSDWNFVSSGDIDFSNYDGESTVYIAFKYVSTTSGAATWEVGNVLLKEGSK